MRRFSRNDRVRTTRTAGQILGHEGVPDASSQMPLLGTILDEHPSSTTTEADVLWRVRFDVLGIEAVVADGDLMPLDHHPDGHQQR